MPGAPGRYTRSHSCLMRSWRTGSMASDALVRHVSRPDSPDELLYVCIVTRQQRACTLGWG